MLQYRGYVWLVVGVVVLCHCSDVVLWGEGWCRGLLWVACLPRVLQGWCEPLTTIHVITNAMYISIITNAMYISIITGYTILKVDIEELQDISDYFLILDKIMK